MNLRLVTPAEARAWLGTRPPAADDYPEKTGRLAAAMIAGLFDPVICLPIQFRGGMLWNGEHRLRAVVAAGVPVVLGVHGTLPQ